MQTRPQAEHSYDRVQCGMDVSLLVAIGDATAREIVRGELHHDLVARKNADVVHADLARDGAEDRMTVLELNAEHGVGQRLGNCALEFDCVFLLHGIIFLSKTTATANDSKDLLCGARLLTCSTF